MRYQQNVKQTNKKKEGKKIKKQETPPTTHTHTLKTNQPNKQNQKQIWQYQVLASTEDNWNSFTRWWEWKFAQPFWQYLGKLPMCLPHDPYIDALLHQNVQGCFWQPYL